MRPSFGAAVRVWARIGLMSFGGPAGQIALMHRILVDEMRWIGERRFLRALNFCMLLPGPEAQQLTVYVGWLLHGVRGGLVAGTLFVLPGFVVLSLLSILYVTVGSVPLVQAAFFGLKAAVLAIVAQALVRIGRRALRSTAMLTIAVAAFLALFALDLPFPIVVLGAGLAGFLAGRAGLPGFAAGGHDAAADGLDDARSALGEQLPGHTRPSPAAWRRIVAIAAGLWLVPVAALVGTLGWDATLSRIAIFFSQLAVVTFGGAYAVLAWVAQDAVHVHGWLQPGEMLDGLGLAETTPGPLIMVLLFVGFLAAYRDPGALDPLLSGLLGGTLATWVTFAPCFLWIFAAAPFVERLQENRALAGALAAITAAVVGVIANLALWFALHVLFVRIDRLEAGPLVIDLPVLATWNPAACLLSALALVAVFWWRLGLVAVLAGSAAAGMALYVVRWGLLAEVF